MESIEATEDYVRGGLLVILFRDLKHLASGADKYDSRESQSLVKTAIDTALKVDLDENVGFRVLLRDVFSRHPITKQQMETFQNCSNEKTLNFMLDFATYIEDIWGSIDKSKLQAMINLGNQNIEVMTCRRKGQFERLRIWLLQLDDGQEDNLTNLLQFNGALTGYLYGPNNQWNSNFGRPSAYQMLSVPSGSQTELDLDSIDLSSSSSANQQRPRTVSVSSSLTNNAITEGKMLTFFDLKNKKEHFDQNGCMNGFLDWFRSESISTEELASKNLQVEAISSYFTASMKDFKRVKEVNLVYVDRVLNFVAALQDQVSTAQKLQMNLLMDQKLRLMDKKPEALLCSLKILTLLGRDWNCILDCIEGNLKEIQSQPRTALGFILFMWRNRKEERLKNLWRLLCFSVAIHSRGVISYASEIASEMVKMLDPVEVISSVLDISVIAAGFELTVGTLLSEREKATSPIDQEGLLRVMERYRTVLTVEETPKDEAVLGEDMLARYGISKSIETTLAFLGPNDRISVATDCACLIMKVFLFAQQPALSFHTLYVLLLRVQNFQASRTKNCYRTKLVKCLTTNLKELKVDWGVKDPRYYFDTIELLRSMFHDVNSGQLPVAVVLFMTNSLEPENQTGSFKEHRSRSLQQHYVNNFFTFLDTTIREALRNEHQTSKEKMIGLIFCLHHMALVDESLRNSVLLCFNKVAQMKTFVKIPQFEQIRAKAIELMVSIWQKQTRKVFSGNTESADIFHRIDKLGLI